MKGDEEIGERQINGRRQQRVHQERGNMIWNDRYMVHPEVPISDFDMI